MAWRTRVIFAAVLSPAKRSLYGLELQACRHPCALDAFGRDLAVTEKSLAERYAAHLQAFQLVRFTEPTNKNSRFGWTEKNR